MDLNEFPYLEDRDNGIPYAEPGETFLDCVPKGWHERFEVMCIGINSILDAAKIPRSAFHFDQVKEKFGALRCYTHIEQRVLVHYAPDVAEYVRQRIKQEIDTAERDTSLLCCQCRHTAHYRSKGWIRPYCRECARTLNKESNQRWKTSYTLEEAFTAI